VGKDVGPNWIDAIMMTTEIPIPFWLGCRGEPADLHGQCENPVPFLSAKNGNPSLSEDPPPPETPWD
jgi:hypothetical protein